MAFSNRSLTVAALTMITSFVAIEVTTREHIIAKLLRGFRRRIHEPAAAHPEPGLAATAAAIVRPTICPSPQDSAQRATPLALFRRYLNANRTDKRFFRRDKGSPETGSFLLAGEPETLLELSPPGG
jgi:hypothetical protein